MAKGKDLLFSYFLWIYFFCLALIAYKLNKALAHEAEDDELEIEVATQLASYAE
jgi:hypothetical protein